jgi:hypothetical protein
MRGRGNQDNLGLRMTKIGTRIEKPKMLENEPSSKLSDHEHHAGGNHIQHQRVTHN